MRGLGFAAACALVVASLSGGAQVAEASQNCTRIDLMFNPLDVPVRPLRGACSGNGQCVLEECVCEDGYTGRSDFIDTTDQDCQINEDVIQGLWITSLTFTLYCMGRSVQKIYWRWQQHLEAKASASKRGVSYSIRANRGLVATLMHTLVVFPSLVCLAVIKLSVPEERIGLTFGATLFYFTAKVGFYSVVAIYQPAVLQALMLGSGASYETKKLLRQNVAATKVFCALGGVIGALPFITLAASDGRDDLAVAVYYMVMGGTTVQLICLGSLALFLKRRIVAVLDKSIAMSQSEHTLSVKAALVKVENESVLQTSVQTSIFLLFTFYVSFSNCHDYFLPVSWFAYALIGKHVAFTSFAKSQRSKGASGNGGSSKGLSPQPDTSQMSNVAVPSMDVSFQLDEDDDAVHSIEVPAPTGSFKNVKAPTAPFPESPRPS